MFPLLAPHLSEFWGPFRLLGSYLVLIGLGGACAALLTWHLLPRLSSLLPRDRGRVHAEKAHLSKGKPTGAGVLMVAFLCPVLLLVLPFSPRLAGALVCLVIAMLTGYFDDAGRTPWGEYRKASLDLAVALLSALVLCQGRATTIWLPLIKESIVLSPWLFVPLAAVLLWLSINATNCSDGVDGLAGSLTLLSLFGLGAFLYGVIGHKTVAAYLLVPHDPEGARWAVLLFTAAGALAGYLWHNAEPSTVLMGDAGSRFLGLLVGLAVLATGNPFLILVMAPVVLANGGTGLVKVALLRLLRLWGLNIQAPQPVPAAPANAAESALAEPARTAGNGGQPTVVVRLLHRVRFPLHDHCRRNLHWSNAQVLMRFVLMQAFLIPLLLVLLVKLR